MPSLALTLAAICGPLAVLFGLRRAAKRVHNNDDYSDSLMINGLSWTEIDQRARPAESTREPSRALSGFISLGETCRAVINADRKLIGECFMDSHEGNDGNRNNILAFRLSLSQELSAVIARVRGSAAPIELDWNCSSVQYLHGRGLVGTFLSKIFSFAWLRRQEHQRLRVEPWIMAGAQRSLFWNDDHPGSRWNTEWNVEYSITNLSSGLSFIVAGHEEAGLIPYIRDLGFFEGGEPSNPYRLHPVVAYSVLHGLTALSYRAREVLLNVVDLRAAAREDEIADRIRLIESDLGRGIDRDDDVEARHVLTAIKAQAARLVEENQSLRRRLMLELN